MVLGVAFILIGLLSLKFCTPWIALALVITGAAFAAVGFLWEALPCCSEGGSLSSMVDKPGNLDLSKYKNISQGYYSDNMCNNSEITQG